METAGRGPAPVSRAKRQPRRRSPPSTSNSASPRSTIMSSVAKRSQPVSSFIPGVEPLPDIVDRVLVETRIEAARDVADMRRGQQVRQAAERMIGRQRPLVEDVDRRAADLA